MNKLTLEWQENGIFKTQVIGEQQPSKIGRDPSQCDIVVAVNDYTISRLHIEIYYQHHNFYIRNLKGKDNPILVNGKSLTQGEIILKIGNTIRLGLTEIKIKDISSTIPPTIIGSSPPVKSNPQPGGINGALGNGQIAPTRGLQCPQCGAISDYTKRNYFCINGHMLADAESVYIIPK